MKFALTFDGELTSNANPQKKWEIRKQLDPQLQKLWAVHPALVRTTQFPYVSKTSGHWIMDIHHTGDTLPSPQQPPSSDYVDLCRPILRGGRNFRPLVTRDLALKCSLTIHFLRQEAPGKIYQGGDMDNRLKTLFDALSVPPHDNQVIQDGGTEPIFCLLEDDALISGLHIETHQLLASPGISESAVKLLIEADVRVTQSRVYSQPFLGD